MTALQSPKFANLGFGVSPTPDCKCNGRGFNYVEGWAETCDCKQPA